MPIYPYECQDCGYKFEVFSKSFGAKDEACPKCHSPNTKRTWVPVSIHSGKAKHVPTEYLATELAVKRHLDNKRPDLAAKEAEKAGRKTGEVERIKKGKYSPKIIE